MNSRLNAFDEMKGSLTEARVLGHVTKKNLLAEHALCERKDGGSNAVEPKSLMKSQDH